MSNDFIKIGNVDLKRSNIKAFGVSSATKAIKKTNNQGFLQSFWAGFKGHFIVETREVGYIFITTFQNDNYTFDEDEINIDRVLASLRS